MPRGGKGPVHHRPIEDFTQDNSDDEDFALGGSPRSTKKRRPLSKAKGKGGRRQKRRRRSFEEDDIVDDSEDMDSEDEFSEEEEPEDIDRDPVTGRPRRNAVKRNATTYAESEGSSLPDEMIPDDDVVDTSADELAVSPQKKPRKMIVKLNLPSDQLAGFSHQKTPATRTRTTRSNSVRATSEARVTRASARNTAEPEELFELTNSGRAGKVAGKTVLRAGGKSIKMPQAHQPSMIMEESQEDAAEADANEGNIPEEDDAQDPLVESIEETNLEIERPEVEPISEEDSEDDGPVVRRKPTRMAAKPTSQARSQSRSQKNKRSGSEEDEWNPDDDADAEEIPKAASQGSKRKRNSPDSDNFEDDEGSDEEDDYELQAEVEELEADKPKRSKRPRLSRAVTDTGIQFDAPRRPRRVVVPKDYTLITNEIRRQEQEIEEEEETTTKPTKGKASGRNAGLPGLFNMAGPFGGTSNASRTLPFGPDARPLQTMGDDSSDDETPARPPNAHPGLTPLTPHMAPPQPHAEGGGPMGFGRVNAKKDMADVTPLAISPDIDFNSVGGLDDHINKLKEMVMLPLLYPELYEQWKVPPPRGVLFHGPPGTGKTLLARALASSVSVGDKKVTFFMRKGADVMSKWVGEAERQLRLLFDEAKKQQPAIIFFDEFDGLAPVRSSKQEQIHASIVTTLLSLMDGMDSRGQIVVIGATNRPDSIDPAFRRPGRFDREFYFPLPNQQARRAIIDIHTRGWTPPADSRLKDDLAEKTRGYGGSDLRALCTEAVINAIQRTYPQIYHSDKKLEFDKSAIKVIAKDFLLSMRRIVPSSERQSAAVAEPLPKKVEPLLRDAFDDIIKKVGETVPSKRKHLTALEEAELEQMDEASGFDAEEMIRAFDRGRVFRPRMLLKGTKGMGQKYLAGAVLHHLEGFFVRNFDLASLTGDPAQSPEAILISGFKEARIHQPSVLLIPQINIWYEQIGPRVVETFSSLLRTLSANDAVLLLGVMEAETVEQEPDAKMMRDLFGFSAKHEYRLTSPNQKSRLEFFSPLVGYVRKRPSDFADREDRKKRKLPELPLAKEEVKAKPPPTKAELKAQYKADRSTLNMLRLALTPVMREVKDKWRQLNKSIIQDRDIEYLVHEQDPFFVTSDLPGQGEEPAEHRPFELGTDKHGRGGLVETATNRFFYNCNTQIIEQRLSNGYYKRPKEFLHDLKTIAKDHKTSDNLDKSQKANDMWLYAEAEVELIERANPQLMIDAEAVYQREQKREKQRLEANKSGRTSNIPPPAPDSTVPSGPIQLGVTANFGLGIPFVPRTPGARSTSNHAHDSHQTNGEVEPSHHADTHPDAMEVDESSGSRPQFPGGFTETPSDPTTYQSQQSGTHKMVQDLRHSTSTTTSGNKSNRTSRGSDPRAQNQTQSTNGNSTQSESLPAGWAPDFGSIMPPPDGSQIPDTQSTNSKRNTIGTTDSFHDDHQMSNGHAPPSQEQEGQEFKHPGLPASLHHAQSAIGASRAPPDSMAATHGSVNQGDVTSHEQAQPHQPKIGNGDQSHVAPIADILNPSTTPPPPPPPFILDETQLDTLHQWIGQATEGLTVEQLEMIDARCMYTVYQSRNKWDRTALLEELKQAVEEVLEDVAWQGQLSTAVAVEYATYQ